MKKKENNQVFSFKYLIKTEKGAEMPLYSEDGARIHAILKILKKEFSITTRLLIDHSKLLEGQSKFVSDSFKKLPPATDIPSARFRESHISNEKTTTILKSLEELFNLQGGEILNFSLERKKRTDLDVIKGEYVLSPIKFNLAKPVVKVNKEVLEQYGLTNIIDGNPHEKEEVLTAINEAAELRIIQRSLRLWNDWEGMLTDAIRKDKLKKIKILVCQPFSTMANERAHVIFKSYEDPYRQMSYELDSIVSSFKNLLNVHKEKIDNEELTIELRLYYRPTAFALYQCLDEKGQNVVAYTGIFWQAQSSFKKPHFQVNGNRGFLVEAINSNFNALWNEGEPEKPPSHFNWYKHLGLKPTVNVTSDHIATNLTNDFERAYHLRSFSNFHKMKPSFIEFECFYHDFNKNQHKFDLGIDPDKGVARVNNTPNENTYYGKSIKLRSSYIVFLHTANPGTPDRIIVLNILIRGLDLKNGDRFFAVYNNSDKEEGQPYAQVMILEKKKAEAKEKTDNSESIDQPNKEKEKEKKKKKSILDFNKFAQILKEKQLILNKIQKEEFNYSYHFDIKERELFYGLLLREMSKAQDQILILGFGPSNYPNTSINYLHNYLDIHLELLKKNVKISRILMEDIKYTNKTFLESLKVLLAFSPEGDLFDSNPLYELYHVKGEKKIPIQSDMIIIDPDLQNEKTAILCFFKVDKKTKKRFPIKMDVLRNDADTIDELYQTYLESIDYWGGKKLELKDLQKVKLIERS